jgi:hypothetical protein
MPDRPAVPVNCVRVVAGQVTHQQRCTSFQKAAQYVSDYEVAAGRPENVLSRKVLHRHYSEGTDFHGWRFVRPGQSEAAVPAPAQPADTEAQASPVMPQPVSVVEPTTEKAENPAAAAADPSPPMLPVPATDLSAAPAVPPAVNPFQFVFGPEAEEMFRNKTVRVTQEKEVAITDERLVDEVQSIAQYHKEGRAKGTLAALCREEASAPAITTPDPATQPELVCKQGSHVHAAPGWKPDQVWNLGECAAAHCSHA